MSRSSSDQSKFLFTIDHSWTSGVVHYLFGMKKALSPKPLLAVRCPTCGAAPREKCQLATGQPRTNPHRDRPLEAKDDSRVLLREERHSDSRFFLIFSDDRL